jgi:polysaccharide deacetylase family protein (PEP-CTERM system associated)
MNAYDEEILINAFSVDFEDWFQCLEVIPLSEWNNYEYRIERNAHRILDLLDEYDIKATFFVLGHVAEKFPNLIKEVDRRGHILGTHGYSHKQVYKQKPEEFAEELKKAIGIVTELTGRRLYGFRAPIFSIVSESLWALDILLEQGLLYDSSIYPVLNYRYGIVSNNRFIHKLTTTKGNTIIEIPIATARYFKFNIPVGGGAYLRILPYFVTRAGLKKINKEQQPFVFYIHPWEIDPHHPKINLPFRISSTHYFNLKSTIKRLVRLFNDFKFAPIEKVFSKQLGL